MEQMLWFYHELLQIPIQFAGFDESFDGVKLGFGVDAFQICLWKEDKWGKGKGPIEIAVRGDLHKILKRIKENGYENVEIQHFSYGESLVFFDPDGNQLTIM